MTIDVLFDLKLINDIGTSYLWRQPEEIIPSIQNESSIGVGLPFAEQRSYAFESSCQLNYYQCLQQKTLPGRADQAADKIQGRFGGHQGQVRED